VYIISKTPSFFLVVSIERLRGSNSDEYNEEDEEIELEIVEVEELDEPVPTQDSCLQVPKNTKRHV